MDHHLDELARLVDTAGAEVVGRLVQPIEAPNPRTYIGSGKTLELAAFVTEHGASLVIFDEELTPAQGKHLERELECRVMDRPEVILDIFAARARSSEAKLQVELAQLEYLLPRLARMWVHLSRIRGGIGLRGPGETQIETDRRMIRRRIALLKQKLAKVADHRSVVRSGRQQVLTAALVGYTNAGKSSLLKALTGADPFIEDRLFATLDTLTRETVLPNSGTRITNHGSRGASGGDVRLRLIDTVGFIRKLPHSLVASFRATLEETRLADVLVHVIDASHPDWEEQVEVVDEVLAELGVAGIPTIHAFNKMDLLPDPEAFADRVRASYSRAACVAAGRREVEELKGELQASAAAVLSGRPANSAAGGS